jgi:hypothetical protein
MSEQPHLNTAQISEIQKRMEGQVNSILDRIQLRKWSVEQALKWSVEQAPTTFTSADEIVTLAAKIYDFASQPSNAKLDLS